MKHRLRLALPPLAQLTPQSEVAFALFDRRGRLLRSGEQSVDRLVETVPVQYVQAILHPDDAIVLTVELPSLPTARLDAAVQSRIEPLVLSELADLCIAHGPRTPDGRIQVAWTSRRPLLEAWRVLHESGLEIKAFTPLELALPPGDPHPGQPLQLPVDARWQASLPDWSLARPEWRPARQAHHWRSALRWTAAAALLWLAGLHLHAAQLRGEVRALQARAEQTAQAAFPALTAILDPLRQTQGQVDRLRLAHGVSAQDDFMPLSLDTAQILGFASGHVSALHYDDGQLTLTLAEGYAPPADETLLQRNATAAAILLRKDADTPHVWHAQRIDQRSGEERS